jgi:hypothetical protein
MIIYHLCIGYLIFKSIGYVDNDSNYTYEVHYNGGDLYKVDNKNLIAKIKFNKSFSNYTIIIQDIFYRYTTLSKLEYSIAIIQESLRSTL